MILKDRFYSILAGEGLHFTIKTNADHAVYKGHFPERPITPGACLLQITQELLSYAKGKPMQLQGVKNLKFVAIHTPDKVVNVDFKDLGNEKYQVTIYDPTTVYVKMSGQYMCVNPDLQ